MIAGGEKIALDINVGGGTIEETDMVSGIVQLRNVKSKFKNSLGTEVQCVFQTQGRNFRHEVAEDFFPSKGTEVQRPEQVPTSGNWNRRKKKWIFCWDRLR